MFQNLKRRLSKRKGDGKGPKTGEGSEPATPKVDAALPRRERRRSSIVREEKVALLRTLPLLKDTASIKRPALFLQKLEVCSVLFNFEGDNVHKKGIELKRQTLLELVDFVNTAVGQRIFANESIMSKVIDMVRANIIRPLPPPQEDFDPDEDDPYLDPAWPHLQVVYEFMLRFVVARDIHYKVARKYLTQYFCQQVIRMFNTEDVREREYIKNVIHRIYQKFVSHRGFIRRTFSNVVFRFVYESEVYTGMSEVLEIYSSIVSGFSTPLKREHVVFLCHALIPLHRPKSLHMYHQNLVMCITQYMEKDPKTAVPVLRGLVQYWPWGNSSKQVILLDELEDLLEMTQPEQFDLVGDAIFKLIGRCIHSPHFQVVERILYLLSNTRLMEVGCLMPDYAPRLLPHIYGPLQKQCQGHWHPGIETMAQRIFGHYKTVDSDLLERCAKLELRLQEEKKEQEKERKRRWEELEKLAAQNEILLKK